MPYEVGPQNGPHEQSFISCYFSGTASSGLMVEWRFNNGSITSNPPLGNAAATEQGWYVEKTRLDPIQTCFSGVAYSDWNDQVIPANRTSMVIASGLCPELYLDTRALGAMPGTQVISGSKLVNAPALFISGVDDGYAMPLIKGVAPYALAFPEPPMCIALGRQTTQGTGTVKAWVCRH